MAEAWELKIPQTEKMVLLCLCDYANDKGECWPAVESLARKCSVSDRTVQRAIRGLVQAGILTVRQSQGRVANTYSISIDQPRQNVTPTECHPDRMSPATPTICRDNPVTVSPKPLGTTIEPPLKKTKRALPDGWEPEQFGAGTKSAAIVSNWTRDQLETHLEHFIAHHRGKGSTFANWQDAWSTWVLNSVKFGKPQSQSRGGSLAEIGDEVRRLYGY